MAEVGAATTPLLGAQEVSDRLGIRLHRTYELAREQQIPHVRIGRQVRFDAAALEEWIRRGGTTALAHGGSSALTRAATQSVASLTLAEPQDPHPLGESIAPVNQPPGEELDL